MQEAFFESRKVYGYRKVQQELVQEKKIAICKETVRSIMGEKGLKSVVKRKFVTTTNSDHAQPVHPNLLDRNFQADCPNQIWAADITYLRTESGWLYLAAVMDIFSRKIVGWAFSTVIDGALVCDALHMALLQRTTAIGACNTHRKNCKASWPPTTSVAA